MNNKSNNLPLVSINCLVYNHAPFLREAFEGFLKQKTNFKFEIIIHDDASNDGSREIIDYYTDKYPDIFFPLIQRDNKYSQGIRGISERYNFPRCRGKYIAMCEGDDYWIDENKLQKQFDFMETNNEYSFCYTRFRSKDENTGIIINDKNDKYFVDNPTFITLTFETLYRGWHMGSQTLFFKKCFLESNFSAGYKHTKDIHLIAHLLKAGKGACLNLYGAIYRIHSGGVYSGATELENSMLSYECYKEIYMNNKSIDFLRLKYIQFTELYFRKLLQHNHFFKAVRIGISLFFFRKTFKVPKN
jgi:glycosyltransferase involved in cell wall biosynthesis